MKAALATLAGGCFWCTEAIFTRLLGVIHVTPGYSGGTVSNPTYKEVCTGNTGHAEAIQMTFDPNVISYAELLDVFFHFHDPTTPDKQGNDEGSQYRSMIFYHDPDQKKAAQAAKKNIPNAVTQIVPFEKFYPAEVSHHDYYAKNSRAPYCRYVIDPKIQKLLSGRRAQVKPEFVTM